MFFTVSSSDSGITGMPVFYSHMPGITISRCCAAFAAVGCFAYHFVCNSTANICTPARPVHTLTAHIHG